MSEALRPVETRRLYQQIADRVRELIQLGQYPVGSRLPVSYTHLTLPTTPYV